MTFALVAHVKAANTASAGIDTTGANLLVAVVNNYNNTPSITDSKGNTWVQIGTTQQTSNLPKSAIFYVASPTVGSGHTFTGHTDFYSVCVQAWSGAHATPLDQHTQALATAAGSITPTEDNELVIAAIGPDDSAGATAIGGGFTIGDNQAYGGAVNEATALAYLVQTTAAAANPTWTVSSGTPATYIASFKASAASGAAVGAASGTGTATGVGASAAASVGAASGTGTATGVGASAAAAVGNASGVGTATGVGASAAGAGAASGTGTATGVGASAAAGVGAASGTGTASGVSPPVAPTAYASVRANAVPAIPEDGAVDPQTLRTRLLMISRTVNLLLRGKMNVVTTLTLTASATSTTLTDERIGPASHIALAPLTENATILDLAPYVSSRASGSAVISHGSTAAVDATFSVLIIG